MQCRSTRPAGRLTTLAAAGLAIALAPALLARPLAAQEGGRAGAPQPITLQEAIRLAQRNSPLAVQARGQERTARADVRSAYAAFIPNVNLTAGGTRQFTSGQRTRIGSNGEVITLPEEPWSYNSGLGLSVSLFEGGRRFYDVGTARAGADAAEANDVTQRYRVALDVAQQYFNVIAARESEAAARAQLEQSEQQLRASIARLAAGAATKSDSLRSVIAVGNARLAMLTAENELVNANAALTRLTGGEREVTAVVDTTESLVAPVDTAALYGLLDEGPAIRQAEANLAAARASRRAARAPYLPTVTASYSRGGTGLDRRLGFGDDPYTYSGALRLSASYPLFNQWQRESGIVRADVAEDNAQATLRDARLLAQQNLTQYLGQMRTAEQRIAIQQASVAAAEEDLRVQQQRYQLGAATLLDVLTSQTQLTESRAALIDARYDYRVARAQIEALVGRQL